MSQLPATPDAKFSAPIDLARVRRLFGAPEKIVESAFLRREIAARMHERLALVKIAPQRVLDAGCGDAADLALLQKNFTDAELVGLDAAPAMLAAARSTHLAPWFGRRRSLSQWLPASLRAAPGPQLLCGDFAQLPFGINTVDLIWSNLALHWHPQPDRIFAEWRRVLRQDGLLMFSCFGPDTFKQLRSALAAIAADPATSLLPFVDMHDFGDMLVNAGFATPVMDMETITVTYSSADKLLADVRALGGNPLRTRRHSLNAGRGLHQALEALRGADGKIPLTFEVIYGHAFRPIAKTTSDGQAIIRFAEQKK